MKLVIAVMAIGALAAGTLGCTMTQKIASGAAVCHGLCSWRSNRSRRRWGCRCGCGARGNVRLNFPFPTQDAGCDAIFC